MTKLSRNIAQKKAKSLKRMHWEAVRRNPQYIIDYNRLVALRKLGTDEAMEENSRLTFEILKKYRIYEIQSPDQEFDKLDMRGEFLVDGNVYIQFPHRPMPEVISASSFKVNIEDSEGNLIETRGASRGGALVSGKFLQILVNIDAPDYIIGEKCIEAVQLARKELIDGQTKMKPEKQARDTGDNAFRVWDLRKQGKKDSEIAMLCFKNDSESTQSRVAKLYQWAEDAIQNVAT